MVSFARLAPGTRLQVGSHDVTIVQYLIEGGFAHIYSVTTRKTNQPEAEAEPACLKRVVVPDKDGLNQLRVEVEVMKKLAGSDKIVRYYDSHAQRLAGSTDYEVLLLMELCPNGSLLDYMNRKISTKLTEGEILKIMFDVTLGVREMHKLRLLHRDIKIENVLINAAHTFKLSDFGLTSAVCAPPQTPEEFLWLQRDLVQNTTPQYRAPEMIDLGRGWPIDEKSDIWALGVFLYKLCYYTTPFESVGELAIVHAAYLFPASPVYSNDLKNLVVIMLQERPDMRPNVNQILYILLNMSNNTSYRFNDFYGQGPYNFVALQEYQMRQTLGMASGDIPKETSGYESGAYDTAGAQPSNPSTETPAAPTISNDLEDGSMSVSHLNHSNDSNDSALSSTLDVNEVAAVIPTLGSSRSTSTASLALDDVEARFPSLEKIDSTLAPEYPISIYSHGDSTASEFLVTTKPQTRSPVSLSPTVSRTAPTVELSSEDAWERGRGGSVNPEANRLAESIFNTEKVENPTSVFNLQTVENQISPLNPEKVENQTSVFNPEKVENQTSPFNPGKGGVAGGLLPEAHRVTLRESRRKSFNPFPAAEETNGLFEPATQQPVVGQPVVGQPVVGQPVVGLPPVAGASPVVGLASVGPAGFESLVPCTSADVAPDPLPKATGPWAIPTRDLISFDEDPQPVKEGSGASPKSETRQPKLLLNFDLAELNALSIKDSEDASRVQRLQKINIEEEVVDFSSENSGNENLVATTADRKPRFAFKKKHFRTPSSARSASNRRSSSNAKRTTEDESVDYSDSSWHDGDEVVPKSDAADPRV